jgi:hypothetical protein
MSMRITQVLLQSTVWEMVAQLGKASTLFRRVEGTVASNEHQLGQIHQNQGRTTFADLLAVLEDCGTY